MPHHVNKSKTRFSTDQDETRTSSLTYEIYEFCKVTEVHYV